MRQTFAVNLQFTEWDMKISLFNMPILEALSLSCNTASRALWSHVFNIVRVIMASPGLRGCLYSQFGFQPRSGCRARLS